MKYITPGILFIIIGLPMLWKKPVYSDFIAGAKEGIFLLKDIFPPLAAIITASAMLRSSGALDIALGVISPITDKIGIPGEVMPLVLIRPLSGSGALGVLSDILKSSGADSYAGRLASVICGSTETTFYCLAIYFAKTRVKNIRRAIPCAVIADIVCVITAVFALRVLGI
ncbi:MAG: spore maturation protein [Clostridia bacterium]|nr:spore maturation protein [Clostridia bacterium]